MNYTENYHLPQWVETDRVQMEDFNEAFATLDTCYGDGRKPAVWTSANLTASLANWSVLAEFDFAPTFVILGNSTLYCVTQNDSTTMTLTAGIYEYRVTVRLSGTSLILSSNDSDLPHTYVICIMAFR